MTAMPIGGMFVGENPPMSIVLKLTLNGITVANSLQRASIVVTKVVLQSMLIISVGCVSRLDTFVIGIIQ
jgi:hypothetical protein